VTGIQTCQTKLGKAPEHIATDNSSAATHEIDSGKRAYNPDYLDLCTHYDLTPLTINVGCPNEQGDVESANRHLKRRLEQHLLLRGSRDFQSVEAYDQFLATVLEAANATRQARDAFSAAQSTGGVPRVVGSCELPEHDPRQERQLLGPLPTHWSAGEGRTL
jgi:transposase InsO family protein